MYTREEVTIDDEEVITMDVPVNHMAQFHDGNDPNFRRILHVIDQWLRKREEIR